MQKLRYFVLISLCAFQTTRSQEKGVVFQIGQHDTNYAEFAIAADHDAFSRSFPHDVDFVVGKSNPKQDWPFIQPGPTDGWAGGRSHAFKITFDLPEVAPGYYRLILDFVSTHYSGPPLLGMDINGTELHRRLPVGTSDEPLKNPKSGRPYTLEQYMPASLFHAGSNYIKLTTMEGSWALYDDLRLESNMPAPRHPFHLQVDALPFFKRTANGPRRVLKASIQNVASSHTAAKLNWKCGKKSGSENVDLGFGENELYVSVPDVTEKTPVGVTLQAGGEELNGAAVMNPARRWRVFIVPTVHTDIGYTDLQDRVAARHADNTMQALAAVEKHPAFEWEFETFWQLDCFLRAHPEKAEEVFQRLREGRMGLAGFFGNMLTGLCSHEALNRSTLNAHELAIRGRFDVQSVILDDVPAAVGTVPMVLAHSGIKYFIEGVNRDRGPYATEGLKNPFYWEGPDGSKVLSHIAPGYAMAHGLISSMQQASERLPGYLAAHDNADYPYDAVLVNGAFGDNAGVAPWLPEVVEQWNAQWAYPELILAKPADFFGYIEKNFAQKIPTLKTDFGGWWEDGAASTAFETALCRRAEERAVTAEMLHALGAIIGGWQCPGASFSDLWRNVLLYDEHTWGAWCSVSEPKSEQTVKQWEVKGSFARKADEESRELLKSGMAKLAELAPASDLVVFNPLAWPRKDVVVTEAIPAVDDLAGKRTIPCQALPEGGSCFIASDLPSVGYRAYRNATLPAKCKPAVTFSPNQMENEFYRVTIDPRTGALKSVYDKEAKRELVDAESEYGLGELVYVTGGEGTYAVRSDLNNLPAPTFTYHRQTASRLGQVNGPVFGELTSEAKADMFSGITLRVRLYEGLKRLDLVYELDKKETTAKEAVYLAFPFALDMTKGGLWLEYPDAITEPLRDQHSSACRDWYSVQRWLAASDGRATVVLSPLDTPLVTLGGMTASTWPRHLSLQRAHLFAYVMNNYWHTNYKAEQGGRQTFRFSLTSNRGAFSARNAVVQGWDMFCRPVAGQGAQNSSARAKAESLVHLEPAGMPLLALKQAEDQSGFVVRTCDLSGAGGTLKLALPRAVAAASTCDLVEENPQNLRAGGKTIALPLHRFSPATLKIRFAQEKQ